MTWSGPVRSFMLLWLLGLAASDALANGAGGAGDNFYPGAVGDGAGTLGNGGTGGTGSIAGQAGSDRSGGAVAGGGGGSATNTATGSVNGEGANGGVAEDAGAAGSLTAGSRLVGGGGGGGAYQDINSGSPAASGVTVFSSGSFSGGTGGIGLRISGSNLGYVNAGSITGGGGGGGGHNSFYMSSGADAVSVGSTDGGAGGAAVSLVGTAVSFSNSGSLTGGGGGGGGTSYALANSLGGSGSVVSTGSANGGAGGAGLLAAGTAQSITNSGSITGGSGGQGGLSSANGTTTTRDSANGGAGGVGVALAGGGATLSNSGSIRGGAGGVAGTAGSTVLVGAGGVGVVVSSNGNTIINAGSIAGGLSGDGTASARAVAVRISGNDNTLQLQAGYGFTGNVVVTAGSGNVLSLGGSAAGSFDVGSISSTLPASYTGVTQYYGFARYAKVGSGSWTLTGSSALAAQWDVNAGLLLLNASLAGATVSVNSGATLGGTGSVAAVSVNSGATLSATTLGSGLRVLGNLAFASGAAYRVGIDDAGRSGRITVGGDLSIASGATLQIVAAGGNYNAGTRYQIASYDGTLSGSFGTIANDFAYLTPSLSYGAGSVSLVLNAKSTFQAAGFDAMAVTANQGAVARALNQLYANGGNALTGALLTASTSQARMALATASGDVVTTLTRSIGANLRSAQQAIGKRMDAVDLRSDGTRIDADPWVSVALSRQRHASGEGGTSGDTNEGSSVSFGHDQMLGTDWLAGVALAASNDRTTYRDVAAQGRSDGLQVAAYLRYRPGQDGLVLKAMAGVGGWSNQLDRQLDMGSYVSQVSGRYRMRGASLYGEAGYALVAAGVVVEPYAGLAGAVLWRPAYAEVTQAGSEGLALAYGSQRSSQVTSVLGTRLRNAFVQASDPASPQWQMDLAWRHGLGSQGSEVRAAFVNGSADAFAVRGNEQGRDEAVIEAGLNLPVATDVVFFGQLGAALAKGYQSYSAQVGVRWWW